MQSWSGFFEGELSAAAALAGLLFVAVSMNQTRLLALGRIVDRGMEALAMLFLVLVIASLPLVPGQPLRLLGGEILAIAAAAFLALVPVQRRYIGSLDEAYRPRSLRMVWLNRLSLFVIALAGATLLARGDGWGLYLLPPGILLSFIAVGINAWVLLVEINR